jgi:hypothetical protein
MRIPVSLMPVGEWPNEEGAGGGAGVMVRGGCASSRAGDLLDNGLTRGTNISWIAVISRGDPITLELVTTITYLGTMAHRKRYFMNSLLDLGFVCGILLQSSIHRTG